MKNITEKNQIEDKRASGLTPNAMKSRYVAPIIKKIEIIHATNGKEFQNPAELNTAFGS
jgi:hypothetical protein